MQVNLHKILGIFAIFATLNIVAGVFAPVGVLAAEEMPISFPVDEVERGEVRVDILEERLNYSNGLICGLGDAYSDDGLEVTIQEWYEDYTLEGSYNGAEWTQFQGGIFTVSESNANFFLPLDSDLAAGDASWAVRVVDSEGNVLDSDQQFFHVITNPEYEICGGEFQPGTYSITGTKYLDMNGNNLADFEDEVVPEWTIRLYNAEWNYVWEVVTMEDGSYLFSELNQGTYYVCEKAELGAVQVYPTSESGVLNQSSAVDEEAYCYEVEINTDSSNNLPGYDFINRLNIGVITVIKNLVDANGNEISSPTEFGVNIYSDGQQISDETLYISDNGELSKAGAFIVLPGTYTIVEINTAGYTNLGCRVEDSEDYQVEVESGENIIVVCTNMQNDSTPIVTISATPSVVVTEPNSILLTANVVDGNGVITYAWECTNGQTGSGSTLNLSTVGYHRCAVRVTDEDGDIGSTDGYFTIQRLNTTPGGSATNGGVVQSSNNNQTPSDADEGITTEETPNDVEGEETETPAQVCDTRSAAYGYVYTDINTDNNRDTNESGISNITLTILALVVDLAGNTNEVEIRTIQTNTLGRWETTLCPGSYRIRIDDSNLPEGSSLLGEDSFEFTVEEGIDSENINFAVRQVEVNGGTNWWLFLIPLVILVLGAGGYAIYSTNQRRD